MSLASWPSVRNKRPVVQRDFRGIDKRDPLSIGDMFAMDSENMTSADSPAMSVRPGYSVLGTFGSFIIGMGVYKETELHIISSNGTWQRLNADGTWTQMTGDLNAAEAYTFTNFKGNLPDVCLIASNGTTAYYYNGVSVQVLTGVPAGAKYITQFADRLWAAVGNELKASAYRMADDWTTVNDDDADSWYTVVESPDGESINGIMSEQSKLIVSKPSATFKLMGYAPSDYDLRPVTFSTGQFNNNSALSLDGWLYQLYNTGFYRYAGGSDPERDFSIRVKDYFDQIDAIGKKDSCIGTDGTRLYISEPIGSVTPNTVIEYDPHKDTYYPWSGISALHFAQIGTTFYIGDASGRVIKLGGTTDGGTAISWFTVSKPFTAPSMAQSIRWMRFWLTVDLPTGSTLKVYLSKSISGEDWEEVGTIIASSDIQRKPIYVSSSMVTNAKQLRYKVAGTGPCKIHEIAWDPDYLPLR